MAGRAAVVGAAAGEEAVCRDGVHSMFGGESVPDLARQVGSEHELEAAGPVRMLGRHPLRLGAPCHPACTLEHILTFLFGFDFESERIE